MTKDAFPEAMPRIVSRRAAMRTMGAAAGVLAFAGAVRAQQAPAANAALGTPASVISQPPRDFSPGANPATYPDPDVLVLDREFARLRVNSPIKRLHTGGIFMEGPAWSSQGNYLIWSDIPADTQYRYLEDDGHISVVRHPANHANGNAFDFQGRLVTCEHLTRRVVRYEHDGSATVLAEAWKGKRLNSPNDIIVHPDGSYWFTDPPFGNSIINGQPDAGDSKTPQVLNNRAGYTAGSGALKIELPANTYRIDPSGRIDLVLSAEDFGRAPNGLAFSPDYKKLYLVGGAQLWSFDMSPNGKSIRNQKLFSDLMVDGIRCGADGMRVDIRGNVYAPSNAGANFGYGGVTVWNPEGKLIGRIRLPEAAANLTFGGPRRDRLFITASQSLYALYLETQGASPF